MHQRAINPCSLPALEPHRDARQGTSALIWTVHDWFFLSSNPPGADKVTNNASAAAAIRCGQTDPGPDNV